MLKITPIEKGMMEVKATYRLNHPRTDLITLQIGHDAACNFPMSVECAFSRGYEFLTDIIPDFAPYAYLLDDSQRLSYYNMRSQNHDGLVMTYRFVPITALAKFLHMYGDKV